MQNVLIQGRFLIGKDDNMLDKKYNHLKVEEGKYEKYKTYGPTL